MSNKVVQENLNKYRKRVALEHKIYNLYNSSYNGSGIFIILAYEIISIVIFFMGAYAILWFIKITYSFVNTGDKNLVSAINPFLTGISGIVTVLVGGGIVWLWRGISQDHKKEIIDAIYELDCLGLNGDAISKTQLAKVKQNHFIRKAWKFLKTQLFKVTHSQVTHNPASDQK